MKNLILFLGLIAVFGFSTRPSTTPVASAPLSHRASAPLSHQLVVSDDNIMTTVENSTVKIGKKSFEIDAVAGHVTHMDLTLKDTVAYQIYLTFYEKTDAGQFVEIPGSEMNADREDFTVGVKKGLPANASVATIKATVNAVMTGMIAGTPAQKWGAYNAVMTGYGAPLLPLAQQ